MTAGFAEHHVDDDTCAGPQSGFVGWRHRPACRAERLNVAREAWMAVIAIRIERRVWRQLPGSADGDSDNRRRGWQRGPVQGQLTSQSWWEDDHDR